MLIQLKKYKYDKIFLKRRFLKHSFRATIIFILFSNSNLFSELSTLIYIKIGNIDDKKITKRVQFSNFRKRST